MNIDSRNIHDAIRLLLSASASARLYGMVHPQVERLVSQAYGTIDGIVQTTGEFSLMVIENELVINGVAQAISPFLNRFSHVLGTKGIGHVKILKGITRQEVERFIQVIASHSADEAELAAGEHVRLGRVEVRLAGAGGNGNAASHIQLPEIPKEEMARLIEIYHTVRRRQKLKITGIMEIVASFVEIFHQEAKPLLVLSALRDSDEYTFTHSTNVCILNLAQAMALGIEGELLKEIGVSAMLHDIGKLFIPEEIITKKGKLTQEEFDLMKQHPVRGARFLLETPGVPRMAAIAAFEHHSKYNLSGYPKLPLDWQQNTCSHLTMISDFFDAVRTRRSYRDSMELRQVTDMMRDMAGTELHPILTNNFLHIIDQLHEK